MSVDGGATWSDWFLWSVAYMLRDKLKSVQKDIEMKEIQHLDYLGSDWRTKATERRAFQDLEFINLMAVKPT